MLKIAVVTAHFPSSAQPTHGRPAYQTLRVLSRNSDVRVFYPHAVYPSLLKPRSRIYDDLDPSYSLPDVKVGYYDYPVLALGFPAIQRMDGSPRPAASCPQLCARSHLQLLSLS